MRNMSSAPLSEGARTGQTFDAEQQRHAHRIKRCRYRLDRRFSEGRQLRQFLITEQAYAGLELRQRLLKGHGIKEIIDQGAADQIAGMEGKRSEEHTSELQSLMRISYAVFCLKTKPQLRSNNTGQRIINKPNART